MTTPDITLFLFHLAIAAIIVEAVIAIWMLWNNFGEKPPSKGVGDG